MAYLEVNVRLRVADGHLGDGTRPRTTIVQQKTGRPVPFELRACQLLLEHSELEGTVRDLGIEADDAPVMPEPTDIRRSPRRPRRPLHPGGWLEALLYGCRSPWCGS